MKYLIVGLGNPGAEYQHTRHNVGFDILDTLLEESESVFADRRYGWTATIKKAGRQIVLLKPSTFMNLSGNAVRFWMQAEKIKLENVLVVTDDLNLPTGKIRIRAKGSDGGHNGLRHISETLGTDQYARLRFGVGADFESGRQVEYVLSKWQPSDEILVKERIAEAVKAILCFTTLGINEAMTRFNG